MNTFRTISRVLVLGTVVCVGGMNACDNSSDDSQKTSIPERAEAGSKPSSKAGSKYDFPKQFEASYSSHNLTRNFVVASINQHQKIRNYPSAQASVAAGARIREKILKSKYPDAKRIVIEEAPQLAADYALRKFVQWSENYAPDVDSAINGVGNFLNNVGNKCIDAATERFYVKYVV
jgi:hypothetical protein